LNPAAILEIVRSDLERVEASLQAIAQVEYPLLAKILSDLFASGGKRLRPALVFFAASFGKYNAEKLTTMATAVEMLHTATLVHDDLIDNAPLRRGHPTINSILSGGIVVLIGDYLFAKAAELASNTENMVIVQIFAQTLAVICDGELRQAFTTRSWQQSEEEYYRKIYAKTASLFAASAEAGAILSEQPPEARQALRRYGHNLGMAFQVVDDILDFVGQESELGKPVGSDLRQGTVTLPAIYYRQMHPDDALLRQIWESDFQDEAALARAIQAIRTSEAIERSYATARTFAAEACAALASFPDNQHRRAMIDLAWYAVERRK